METNSFEWFEKQIKEPVDKHYRVILQRARNLIQSGWTNGTTWGRDDKLDELSQPFDAKARFYTIKGAITKACGDVLPKAVRYPHPAWIMVEGLVYSKAGDAQAFNDKATKEEVLAVFDEILKEMG